MDVEVKDGKIPSIFRAEVSTFTIDTLLLADNKLVNILSKHQDTIPQEELEYLMNTGIPPQGGRGGK